MDCTGTPGIGQFLLPIAQAALHAKDSAAVGEFSLALHDEY